MKKENSPDVDKRKIDLARSIDSVCESLSVHFDGRIYVTAGIRSGVSCDLNSISVEEFTMLILFEYDKLRED